MNASFSSSRLSVLAFISRFNKSKKNAQGISERQKSRKSFTEGVKGPIFMDTMSWTLTARVEVRNSRAKHVEETYRSCQKTRILCDCKT